MTSSSRSKSHEGGPDLRFVMQRILPFAPQLAIICAVTLLSSLAMLAVPWLAGRALGGLVGTATIDLPTVLAGLVAALIALTALNIAVAILSEAAAGRILAALRRETYAHIQSLPISVHNEKRSGELLAASTYEIGILSTFLTATIATLPSTIITAIGALILLIAIDPLMGIIVPLLIPVFYIMSRLVGRRLRTLAKRVREAEVGLFEQTDSDLEMLPAIKAFALEARYRDRHHDIVEKARRADFDRQRLQAFVQPLIALIASLAALAILVWGQPGAGEQERSVSELFTFLLYAALLTRPAGRLASIYGEAQWARGALADLFALLSTPREPGYDAPGTMARARGTIRFEQVSFGYSGRGRVLEGAQFEIGAGETIAITGANGAGKSTLIALLMRFYDPDSGRILLDGRDIAEIDVQDLRRQFGYVPQRALLFDGTITQNITLDSGDAGGIDEAAIERALTLSGAADFVGSLPEGRETIIGDEGVRLSGGQRQRVALARALYADPPILVLDEATSMYDLPSEAAFVERCIEALGDRTIIIITHRTASLKLADRVLEARADGVHPVPKPATTRA